jgi:uncharacterized Ntn-hydrolase superfamily protein
MTYSIVAIDKTTQELGVGVQTHQPAVGAGVPWVRPGVGAVASQSMSNPDFGPQLLDLLEDGLDARRALKAVLVADTNPAIRQVAVVDRYGTVAAHTGDDCIAYASHIEAAGFSVQANMMLSAGVPEAMKSAFESSSGPLPFRILAALEAAQSAGGDIRGCQSAALVVMRPGSASVNTRWNLRVDDAPDPLAGLRRLVMIRQASGLIRDATEKGTLEDARAAYAEADRLAPSDEQTFWFGVRTLAIKFGEVDSAVSILKPLFDRSPTWLELLFRLKGPNRCPPLQARFANGPRRRRSP